MIPQYLCITSLLMLLPVLFFANKSKKSTEESVLACLLLINASLSFAFWLNPVKNGTIHYYDAIFTRISMILFSVYILFIKDINFEWKFAYFLMFSIALYLFRKSDKYSSKEWCSKEHIFSHILFHIFIICGAMFPFI
jgi:hypothetical protein